MLSPMDLHVEFRETHINKGLPDNKWKNWKLFKDLKIEELSFQEGTRKYRGEIQHMVMQGFGVFEFLSRKHRYEGEFFDDNFEGYGCYVWQNER